MAQGKGILQPHDLIDELEKVITDYEARLLLSEGPFGEVVKSAQVCSNSYLFFSLQINISSIIFDYSTDYMPA